MSMLKNTFRCTLVAVALVAIPVVAQQNDSALVQAAKQKSTAQKAKHVFTDEDFPGRSDSTATAAPDDNGKGAVASSESGDATKSAAAEDKMKPGDSKADAAKMPKNPKVAGLESKLADSKKDEAELRRKLGTLQEKANNERDEFRKNMYVDMISNQQTTLSEYRRTQEDLQKQIEEEKSKSDKSDKTE